MLWQRFGLRWLPTGMEWQAIAYDANVCNTFMMQVVEKFDLRRYRLDFLILQL